VNMRYQVQKKQIYQRGVFVAWARGISLKKINIFTHVAGWHAAPLRHNAWWRDAGYRMRRRRKSERRACHLFETIMW